MSLNQLIGYVHVELADSNKIWPEHSLSIEEQNCVRARGRYSVSFRVGVCRWDSETLTLYQTMFS